MYSRRRISGCCLRNVMSGMAVSLTISQPRRRRKLDCFLSGENIPLGVGRSVNLPGHHAMRHECIVVTTGVIVITNTPTPTTTTLGRVWVRESSMHLATIREKRLLREIPAGLIWTGKVHEMDRVRVFHGDPFIPTARRVLFPLLEPLGDFFM